MDNKAQEPVAWIYQSHNSMLPSLKFDGSYYLSYKAGSANNPDIPLYTHPAPSWQGLSDYEIDEIIEKHDGVFGAVVRAIEQALRTKNES